jgi:hypothetical protein
MSNPNYSLEVISHHPNFKNKNLRKYYVEGIDTIGAWGDEPFEIVFKNNTWQKVQVKLTIDGTDILTGDLATSDNTNNMWVVNGYGTLSLKAWPETNNGGAAFVFTSANNSVAIHTHGDLSNRGIIAAAVYTEGHVEPIIYNPILRCKKDFTYPPAYPSYPPAYPIWIGVNNTTTSFGGGGTYSSSSISCQSLGSSSDSISQSYYSNNSADSFKSLESLAAVGAGQHVDQKISYVAGLIKPVFTESVRVKYMWWDDLVSKLRSNNVAKPHPSGFPADRNKNIDLGTTPKIGNFGRAFPRQQEESYLRV